MGLSRKDKMRLAKGKAKKFRSKDGGKYSGGAADQTDAAALAFMKRAEREGWDLTLEEARWIAEGD